MLHWAAMSGPNCIVGMYNDTSAADGGMPTPFYSIAKRINQHNASLAAVQNADTSRVKSADHFRMSAKPTTASQASTPWLGNKGGGVCTTDRECHYCGVCGNASVCVCDAAWTGSHCEQLHLLPARVGSGYPDVPASGHLPSPSPFTWGGAVLYADGRY